VKGLSRGEASLRTLHAYRAAGFTTWQILRAATINASELLGLSTETGAVESGRLADIVAAPGDVLADPSLLDHVSFVMKAGKVVIRGPEPQRRSGDASK
jgi:imidazolonepropionase-like amidohydrolase